MIGIERGWYDRSEVEGDRVAGIRTFSLVGLLGGICASMIPIIGEWVLGVAFLALAALVITSHWYEIKVQGKEDIGITTEVALLLTFSLGSWAAMGYQLEALGCAVVVMAILSLKPLLHAWLQKIEMEVIYAGIKLLVISLIMLPLLPNQGFGPWNMLNPYWIWWMVVLISGLSFIGFLLVKYTGENRGTMLTAVIGGLASSTAVTISLAKLAKQRGKRGVQIYMAGVMVASSVMFIRVIAEVLIVNKEIMQSLWVPMTSMLLLTLGGVAWLWFRSDKIANDGADIQLSNPLQLLTAIKFGALLALILVLSAALKEWYGDRGIYLLAMFSGLMDVDAITVSLSDMAKSELSEATAAMGIVLAVITNTLVKAGLFISIVGFKRSVMLLWMLLVISTGGILSMWWVM